jgi:hypothetical protein
VDPGELRLLQKRRSQLAGNRGQFLTTWFDPLGEVFP